MKPLLAYQKTPQLTELVYPLYASIKVDGIRCLTPFGEGTKSRSMKRIPNDYINAVLTELNVEGFDGELCLAGGDFNSVQSAVMSRNGSPNFYYKVFDICDNPDISFQHRLALLHRRYEALSDRAKQIVKVVDQHLVHNASTLDSMWSLAEAVGEEGLIVRDPRGRYKYGRSTLKQGIMIKLVRWHRAEATITDKTELLHNENDPTINAVGAQVRSHEMAGQVPGDKLGAFVCVMPDGKEFKVGSGFSDHQRHQYWRAALEGKVITYKYKELSSYGVPRHPIFVGFRHPGDMS